MSKIPHTLFLLGAAMLLNSCSPCCSEKADNAQIVIDNIMTRKSVRTFTAQAVEQDKIDLLVRAGMAAPSARNAQPWAILVVRDPEKLKILAEKAPNSRTATATVALVVCGDLNRALDGEGRDFWVQDASAMTENILLAAHALKLGAVWTGIYPAQSRVKLVQELFKMPENIVPLCIIPVGYPAEDPAPKDKFDAKKVFNETF